LAQLLAPIAAERDWSVLQLADVTASDRYLQLLESLEAFATVPPLCGAPNSSARDAMPKLVRRSWRQLHRAVRALEPDPPAESLHRIRILTKRTRYAVEAVDGLGFPRSRTLGRRLTDLQDHLGRLNDHVVAEAWLRQNGPEVDDPNDAFLAGELAAAVRHETDRLVQTWHEPWDRVDRGSLRRWF
jgi:CHAD domain-containing protein